MPALQATLSNGKFGPQMQKIHAKMNPESQAARLKSLSNCELAWSRHYQFLADRGYALRQRYKPGWQPSWIASHKHKSQCEDAVPLLIGHTIDALNKDGTLVSIKKIDVKRNPEAHEIVVGEHFSKLQNPKNHCVPIFKVLTPLEDPGIVFSVMPLLYDVHLVPFKSVADATDFILQVFEGLQFMHENGVVHGDCRGNNIMADSMHLFNSTPHPSKPSMAIDFSHKVSMSPHQANKPVKYYLVGFEQSHIFSPKDLSNKSSAHYKYFAEDVRCIADTLRKYFLDGYDDFAIAPKQGFEFMRGLIADMMMIEDPHQQPTMSEVVPRFKDLVASLEDTDLHSPVKTAGEPKGFVDFCVHWRNQVVMRFT